MATQINDPYSTDSASFADTVHESEQPEKSRLLGPNGKPLSYQPRQKLGFDLSKRKV